MSRSIFICSLFFALAFSQTNYWYASAEIDSNENKLVVRFQSNVVPRVYSSYDYGPNIIVFEVYADRSNYLKKIDQNLRNEIEQNLKDTGLFARVTWKYSSDLHLQPSPNLILKRQSIPHVRSSANEIRFEFPLEGNVPKIFSSQPNLETEGVPNNKERMTLFYPKQNTEGETSLPKVIRKIFKTTKTWAVVIGIDNYSNSKNGYNHLPYAVADAKSIKNTLVAHLNLPNERIITLYNDTATRKNIEKLLGDELPKRVGNEDRLLFYFSGHGETYSTTSGDYGFLVPIDGQKQNLYSTCLSMKQIGDFSDLISARQILFIIDACYSGIAGLINKSGDNTEEKLRSVNEAQIRIFIESRGRQIMTAGASMETAFMGRRWDNHSVYTYYLLRGIRGEADFNRDNIISVLELQVYLNTNVSKDTDGKQNPQIFYLGTSEGQFIFYKEGDF